MTRKQIIIAASCILVFATVGILAYLYHAHTQETLRQSQEMTEEQARDADTLRERLRISEGQAQQLARAVERAQEGKVQPVTHVTVTAPTVERAAAQVQERINHNDKTLLPAALEKTDRTVVAPQPENKDYQVGVYKINLDKRRKIKAGITQIDTQTYWTAGVQLGRWEGLVHGQAGKVKGGSVMYTVAEW
jgi:peptidase, M22 family|nr:MAG TPA: immunity protein [Caudoviricetes sp.]DAT08292.1 MAG TPA: immunity protein [Caudoviricetes sp.]